MPATQAPVKWSPATNPPRERRSRMAGDRFALVTGGSRGIGRAVALALAEHGYDLGIHYHTRRDAAEQVLAEVRARGADGFIVSADVTQADHVGAIVERVEAEFGALD